MNALYKVRLLLVVFLILGCCVSCGKKSAPDTDAPKKVRKKREKKVEPPPVEEVKPVEEKLPELSNDYSTWSKEDFLRARREEYKGLMDACMYLGQTSELKSQNQAALDILAAVLRPVDPPEMEELVPPEESEDPDERQAYYEKKREYDEKVREQEETLRNLPKLDSRKIDYILEQMAKIGTKDAWDTLLSIWQQKILTDDDGNIDQSVLKVILDHPQTNNKDIVFTLLTNPESLVLVQTEEKEVVSGRFEENDRENDSRRDKKERRTLEPNKVFEEALNWAKQYADVQFRINLAKYVVNNQNEAVKERNNKIVAFLMEKLTCNFPAQGILYSNNYNEAIQTDFATSLEKWAIPAYACFTDQSMALVEELYSEIEKKTGTKGGNLEALRNGKTAESTADTKDKPEADEKSDEKSDEKAVEKAETEGADSDKENVAEKENAAPANSSEDKTPEEAFTILEPFETQRISDQNPQQTMVANPEFAAQVLDVVWSDNYISQQRLNWEKAQQQESDFTRVPSLSFLLALPLKGERNAWYEFLSDKWDKGPDIYRRSPFTHSFPINPGILISVKQLKRNSAPPEKKNTKKNQDRNSTLSVKEQALQTSIAWMSFTKEVVSAEMGRLLRGSEYQARAQRDVSKLKARMPFTVPEKAEIVAEYHFLLPNSSTKDKNWEFDPLEVHFVRIKWTAKPTEINKSLRYKGEAPLSARNCPNSKNVWLEYFKDSDSLFESMDVIINDVDSVSQLEGENIFDILTIRMKK